MPLVFMESYKSSLIISFLLIFLIGILCSVTDLRHRKIRNKHLMILSITAVIFALVKIILDGHIQILQMQNIICAVIISIIFYMKGLWAGGDAKLFVLYSFIMPVTGYESKMFLPTVVLFVNTFIIALIFVCLVLLVIFIRNSNSLKWFYIKKYFNLMEILRAILLTNAVAWIIFPLLSLCGLAKYGFLIVCFINVSIAKKINHMLQNKVIVFWVIVSGLMFRLINSPDFFLLENLLNYLKTVIGCALVSMIFYQGKRNSDYLKERIPFAPFLFLGCLLSYTPFLWWIMSLQLLGK